MAKQIGIHPISGKFGNAVYYQGEQVGAVMRKTYDALGDRVKTAAEYANTRRNNSEFGMTSHVAGTLIRQIKSVCNFTLKNRAFVELANFYRANLGDGSWGERKIEVAADYATLLNGLSKNGQKTSFIDMCESGYVVITPSNMYLTFQSSLDLDAVHVNELIAAGANSIVAYLCVSALDSPTFNAGHYSNSSLPRIHVVTWYTKALVQGSKCTLSYTGNQGYIGPQLYSSLFGYKDQPTNLGGVYLICLPMIADAGTLLHPIYLKELAWHEFACV